jgi:phosphatidate cytidylyltransferase
MHSLSFDNKTVKIDSFQNISDRLRYPSICYYDKNSFGINGYNPKIISIFILIWTNDSFAYIVGKSIEKQNCSNVYLKTIEGFMEVLYFALLRVI